MQAPQRMHFSEYQKSSIASRAERPLSTSTKCISAPFRGPRKCDVYCVIGEPSALRDSMRMNTPRCSSLGITFSMPIDAMCSGGTFALRSALPSFVHTVMPPVSATAKLQPVMPASAFRISGRVAPRFGEVMHIAVIRIGPERLRKHPGDVGCELVNRRHDDMRGALMIELLD